MSGQDTESDTPWSALVNDHPVTRTGRTGTTNIDALLGGTKWGGAAGQGDALTFSFAYYGGAAATFAPGIPEASGQLRYGFNAIQAQAARSALDAWASVANLSFREVAETASGSTVGDLRFAYSSGDMSSGTWGQAYFPGTLPEGGDVWLSALDNGANSAAAADWLPGTYNHESLMHEIGHALGLKHPGNYGGSSGGPYLGSFYDSIRYTVMSYNETSNLFRRVTYDATGRAQFDFLPIQPETPMVLDVAAIQHLYGANMAWRTGDDMYTFNPNQPFYKTIWDAGGSDTISVANFTAGCTVDLNAGAYSSIRIFSDALPPGFSGGTVPTYDGTLNLGIAQNVTIENATGGLGGDTLVGNSANNRLTGGGGGDSLDGGAGVDTAVYSGARSGYTVSRTDAFAATVTDQTAGRDGSDALRNMERLQFADGYMAMDTSGNGGQAYRLYQAAFDRTPDAGGLGFQMRELDTGRALAQVAQNFINSPEFNARYGQLDNAAFVAQLYANVLDRAPDASGLAFHVGNLATGANTRANVLVGFSESPENQAALIGVIQAGMFYTL